jgi:nicotinamidase-related amidase
MKLIVVVDLQNEFLGWQPKTIQKELPEKVVNYVEKQMENRSTRLLCTRDTHLEKDYDEHFESWTYPLHCVRGTWEWEIAQELECYMNRIAYKNCWVINKPTYGDYTEILRLKELFNWEFDQIEVVGLTTDICVLATMVMLNCLFPKAELSVIDELTYGTSEEKKQHAYQIINSMGFHIKTLQGFDYNTPEAWEDEAVENAEIEKVFKIADELKEKGENQ